MFFTKERWELFRSQKMIDFLEKPKSEFPTLTFVNVLLALGVARTHMAQ